MRNSCAIDLKKLDVANKVLALILPDGKPFVEVEVNSDANWDEDAEFIAHAREDIPYLLGLIQKLLEGENHV